MRTFVSSVPCIACPMLHYQTQPSNYEFETLHCNKTCTLFRNVVSQSNTLREIAWTGLSGLCKLKLRNYKPEKIKWRYQESTISGGIDVLLLFRYTCRVMVLSDQYRVAFKKNLFSKPFKMHIISSTEQLAVVYGGLPMFGMPANMTRLTCVGGWAKKDIVYTPMVTGDIVIVIQPTNKGDFSHGGLRKHFFPR